MICLYSAVENLAILILYRQPDDKYHGHPSTPNDFTLPLNRVKNVLTALSPTPDIVLGGDFNLPHASWPEGTPTPGATIDERSMLNALNEFSNELFLSQYVLCPTHKDGNILDLVFVNNSSLIHDCSTVPVLHSTTHHSIVQISTSYKVKCETTTSEERSPRTLYNTLNFFSDEINWEVLTEEMSTINWKEILKDSNSDTMLDKFYSTVYDVCSEHVPMRKKEGEKKN